MTAQEHISLDGPIRRILASGDHGLEAAGRPVLFGEGVPARQAHALEKQFRQHVFALVLAGPAFPQSGR